jgi:carbamate kinase
VIVGSLIVAFGGGGIPVAREYLQRWRVRGEAKAAEIRSNINTDAAADAMEGIRPDTP